MAKFSEWERHIAEAGTLDLHTYLSPTWKKLNSAGALVYSMEVWNWLQPSQELSLLSLSLISINSAPF